MQLPDSDSNIIDVQNGKASESFIKANLLSRAFIETPCESSWDKMTGTNTVRFCQSCNLNVYNIADMTDKEAETVFAKGREGRVCARLFRRPDGKILTDNCPRSLRKIRDASRYVKAKVVASIALLLSLFAPSQAQQAHAEDKKSSPQALSPARLGDVCIPAQKKTPAALEGIAGGLSFRPIEPTVYKISVQKELSARWKKKGIKTQPQVELKIDATGAVTEKRIIQSSNDKQIDEDALKAIGDKPFAAPPAGVQLPVVLYSAVEKTK